MPEVIDRLKGKGWAEEEIRRTARILEESPEKKSPKLIMLDKIAYWTGLFLAILANFVISVMLIPFLIVMKSFYLYLALIFIGVAFGWVFSLLIADIESIKTGQHIVAWIFIPAIALINVYLMTDLSNFIAVLMEMPSSTHHSTLVSVVYVASFMLPYSISKLIKKQSL
ncbi:hypothetical protein JW707_00080 [Candidatus Woesearchaeota archaeon]|nr:hypothetical protein [Candidatus Woesearchaeota archaeon]